MWRAHRNSFNYPLQVSRFILNADEWLAVGGSLVDTYGALRREVPLRSEHEDQRDALALVSWDIGAFIEAQLALARLGHWSPAYSMGRMITERSEHLIALHHDPNFAARFMAATRALSETGARGASRRVTDARGVVRRFIREVMQDEEFAKHNLEGMIRLAELGSLALHPSAVVPALAALNNPDDPDFLAYQVAANGTMALYSFVLVAERRMPSAVDYQPARDLVRLVARQGIEEADRWDTGEG